MGDNPRSRQIWKLPENGTAKAKRTGTLVSRTGQKFCKLFARFLAAQVAEYDRDIWKAEA